MNGRRAESRSISEAQYEGLRQCFMSFAAMTEALSRLERLDSKFVLEVDQCLFSHSKVRTLLGQIERLSRYLYTLDTSRGSVKQRPHEAQVRIPQWKCMSIHPVRPSREEETARPQVHLLCSSLDICFCARQQRV